MDAHDGRMWLRGLLGFGVQGQATKPMMRPPGGWKRALDIVLSAAGLLVSAPLWPLIALVIKLEDGGSILYRQLRVGYGERLFEVTKFRSMIPDAEQSTGPVLAEADDVRITEVGRVLRLTALDELPQLLNILRGDMSFVGPRPERPELVNRFRREVRGYDQRFAVRPGLTGLAQVHGRYDSTPREKLRFEILYVKRQSLWVDVKLIALSVWITARGKWQVRGRKI